MADEGSGSLLRALALLDGLASGGAAAEAGWGVNRLAAELGRDASQVSRTLRILADAGYVERDPETLRYRIGWHVAALAARATDGRLVAAAGPVLRRLAADDLGERAHLTVRAGTDVLTILTEGAPHSVQSVAWVGRLVPAWNTSSGRSLLLDFERAELTRLFARTSFGDARPTAPRTVVDLYERIASARAVGYVLVDEEFEEGLVAASAPIRDFRGTIVAALNVSGPSFRLAPRLTEAGETVRAAAADLSRHLGWTATTPVPPTVAAGSKRAAVSRPRAGAIL